MDFTVAQKGNTRFMYILPYANNEALFEYTLFSKDLLPYNDYKVEIEKYFSLVVFNYIISNGDAHLKRSIMGREVVVAITNGKLDFGTWEQIFYGEFDGRRRKRVLIKIIGE